MKALHLLGLNAAMSALLIFAAAKADAQQRQVGFGHRQPPPPPVSGNFQGFFPGFYVYEREVVRIVEKEVPAPAPTPAPAEPPAEPRKPFAIGESYSSLPGPCMKMIEEAASHYHCSGEWYRQVGSGSAVQYLAVSAP